jgi:hypothetical protein
MSSRSACSKDARLRVNLNLVGEGKVISSGERDVGEVATR